MLGVIGIFVSLGLLMLLAYRGANILVFAPLCLLVAVVCDGATPLLASYTQIFMPSVGQFIAKYFPLFVLGAIFGKLMEASGSARKIAEVIASAMGKHRAMLAVVLTCTVLTYGGVSLFVVVFVVFPLANHLFRQADLPRRMIPATIALGSFTYTMTAMPGSVQLPNLIPMPYFKTTSYAAPWLGVLASIVILLLGMGWLNYRSRSARARGEGYGIDPQPDSMTSDNAKPSGWSAFLPVLCVIVANYGISQHWLPTWSASYLSEPRFGSTELSKVMGVWSAVLAMLLANALTIFLHFRDFSHLNRILSEGAQSCLLPVFNTATEFGYGSAIAALTGFTTVKAWVTGIFPSNPLVSEAISVNLLAGITGSASGGLSIAMETLGKTYYERSQELGIDPELLHRVAAMSCGGLDSLPHNGALITLLLICRTTHRESYLDVAVVTVLLPIFATILVVLLGSVS